MSWLSKLFKRAPKAPKMVDVGKSHAHISTPQDSYVISREGSVGDGFLLHRHSKDVIIAYLSLAKNIYVSDNGDIIPIHTVTRIKLVHEPKLEALE